ncbi:MAG: transcription termination/antitermination protein NusG [Phenylobacterium sp.]|uniref:transcription termination/antitermination protein NusG n=1 Tax=Phenylobacterium sp. TaxID=1871053 RepID=UPI00391B7691
MDVGGSARPGARWYLVHAKTGREAAAEAQLRRQDFTTFLPLSLRTVRHARKIETRAGAYFPGYLFVELDLERDRWRAVNSTIGVVRLVMARERPLPAPRGLVEALKAQADARGLLDLSRGLGPGDAVSVLAGPFAGQFGVIDQLRGPDRVRVLLDLMNRELGVEVGRETIAGA